MDNRMWYILK